MVRKSLLLITTCCLLSSCISLEERRAAAFRVEQILQTQCSQTMGLKQGTQDYMDCRMFYEEVLDWDGVDLDYMSLGTAERIGRRIEQLNYQCRSYWGTSNVNKSALWSCVQQKEQEIIDEKIHQKELKEQEEVLTRSIYHGQKAANDDARLQERIDRERERVAREKGKPAKKVKCKTYHKSNGYIQVKCK